MKEIKHYFQDFIQAEKMAAQLRRTPDINSYNRALGVMDNFLTDSLKSQFGMLPLEAPKDESYYASVSQMDPVNERSLFRIDKVKLPDQTEAYTAFVSRMSDELEYFFCLVAREINGKYLIIARLTYGYGRDEVEEQHWYNSGGEPLEFKDLQNIIETERLLPPEDDENSMKQYLS